MTAGRYRLANTGLPACASGWPGPGRLDDASGWPGTGRLDDASGWPGTGRLDGADVWGKRGAPGPVAAATGSP